MSQESIVASLLAGIEFDDPRLYDLINAFSGDFYKLLNKLEPPDRQSFGGFTGALFGPPAVQHFLATPYPTNLRLTWDQAALLSSYEIRYLTGVHGITSWDIAETILTTSTLSADIDPLAIPLTTGDYTFLIKSISQSGIYSTLASELIFTVPEITLSVITSTVVGNSVLLYWTQPDSLWAIDYYEIFKNGVIQGTVSGTFEAIFETVGGTFTYTIDTVDIVGNKSRLSGSIVVIVQNPADFVLHSTLNSALAGTKVNCAIETIGGNNYLLACINSTEQFQDHFINHSWASPQAQITAGYPIYIEPTQTTGSYTEVFDFGSVISNVIVVMNWNKVALIGTVSTGTSTIEVSNDNITYGAPATGTSVFVQSVRYVRFKLNFVGADDKSLAYFYNIQCLLNVHFEHDGGAASVLASDVGGTVVNFVKAFKSILSITITANSTTPIFTAYDFTSTTNPTSFKVFAYNTAGARVNANITWLARGIF